MIDLAAEQLITLEEAVRLRPEGRGGRPTHVSTVYRWIKTGVRGVRLEGLRLGGRLHTSREALQRFADRLTGLAEAQPTTRPDLVSATARRRAGERAARKLDALGL
jgi:hypothetical protein